MVFNMVKGIKIHNSVACKDTNLYLYLLPFVRNGRRCSSLVPVLLKQTSAQLLLIFKVWGFNIGSWGKNNVCATSVELDPALASRADETWWKDDKLRWMSQLKLLIKTVDTPVVVADRLFVYILANLHHGKNTRRFFSMISDQIHGCLMDIGDPAATVKSAYC